MFCTLGSKFLSDSPDTGAVQSDPALRLLVLIEEDFQEHIEWL